MAKKQKEEITKNEAFEKFETLKKEVIVLEWDIRHNNAKLKQGLYEKKKAELENLRKALEQQGILAKT